MTGAIEVTQFVLNTQYRFRSSLRKKRYDVNTGLASGVYSTCEKMRRHLALRSFVWFPFLIVNSSCD